jgi:autotransporter-associated beta strand protein
MPYGLPNSFRAINESTLCKNLTSANDHNRTRVNRRRPAFGVELLENRLLLTVEIESNDSQGSANLFVSPTDRLDGVISSVSDVDFWQTALTQGQTLEVRPGALDVWQFDPNDPNAVPANAQGQLHYAPATRIVDPAGNTLGLSNDGRVLRAVVPVSGTYYVRVSSDSAYGPFVGGYRMPVRVWDFVGASEAEPNDSSATATSVTPTNNFRGTLSSGTEPDFYSFAANAGQAVAIKFANLINRNPSVRLYRPNGTQLAFSLDGVGLHASLPDTGTYRFELRGDNSAGTVTGQYVGEVVLAANPMLETEPGNSFTGAATINASSVTSHAIGTLSSLSDIDVFAVDFTAMNLYEFRLVGRSDDGATPGPDDVQSTQNRVLTLYNEYGQILEFSTNGLLGTTAPNFGEYLRPEWIGRHFIAIQATSASGLGGYAISVRVTDTFTAHRDVPLFFQDYENLVNHLADFGCAPEGNFIADDTIDLLVGLFESQYDIYDVDVTTAYPGQGVEHVGMGMRDFSCTGETAGLGSGSWGVRHSNGDSVADFTGAGWDNLFDLRGPASLVWHEVGHGTGVPHARDVQHFMGYDSQGIINAVGSAFPFPDTDSRVPEVESQNKRDYLDWVLQSGRLSAEAEPNGSLATAQSLDPFFAEMTFELQQQPAIAVTVLNNVPARPHFVTTGDINGDTRQDLVVALEGNFGIDIFLQNADGSFAAPVNLATASDAFHTERVAVADLNGDSRADLAYVNYFDHDVSVRLQNPNGTFQAAVNYSAQFSPSSIVAADLTGDNRPELIVASSVVNVLVNNGNGTFQAAQQYPAGSCPISVAVALLNADSNLDVITANQCTGDASVLLGNGNGTLQAASHYAAGSNSFSIAVGDFDGDGNQDLAVANVYAFNVNDDTVSLLRGNGNGTFQPAVNYSVSGDAYSLAAEDLNGDTRDDLVVSSYSYPGHIEVLLGNTNGTFQSPIRFDAGQFPAAVAISTLVGDSKPDIIVANNVSNDVTVQLGKTTNEPRNDRVMIAGRIATASDVDLVRFTAAASDTFAFDIDAAEFQMPLNARIEILDSGGGVVAQNQAGRDWDSGLDSVDPFLIHTFSTAGTYYVRVSGEFNSVGNYRLRVTPARAFDTAGPRVLAAWPDGGASVDSTRQLIFWFNDQLDPATLTSANIVVQGNSTGVRTGSAMFDPIELTLTWLADSPLPADTFTITLNGGTTGIKDLRGNRMDGESGVAWSWPEVSGDGTPGGNFSTTLTITGPDTSAPFNYATYFRRHPYNRSQFTLWFDDELDVQSLLTNSMTLRGAGSDGVFGTTDDTYTPVDLLYDKIAATEEFFTPRIEVYTRGVLDSDVYRLEASYLDAAGNPVSISRVVTAPSAAVGGDFNRTTDATFEVEVPTGTYDVTLTFPGPPLQASTIAFSLENFFPEFRSVRASEWVTLTRQVFVSDGELTIRLEDGGFADPNIGISALDIVDVNNPTIQRHFDFGTPESALGIGYTQVTHTTTFPGGQPAGNGYGWTSATVGNVTSGSFDSILVCSGLIYTCSPVTAAVHGPSVADTNIQPGTVATSIPSTIDVTFSGSVNPTTLTSSNFVVRYSADPVFFDGNDTLLPGSISWNPRLHRASFEPANALVNGYYLIELEGDAAGITDLSGNLLDGEYLDSAIASNTTLSLWKDAPSGNGLPGGDYRAYFVIDAVRIWDGGGSTNNWSEAANWSGDVVPDAGSAAVFNGTSTKNATVDAPFSGTIGRLTIEPAYSGIITLDRSLTLGALAGTGTINLGNNTLTTGGDNSTTTFSGTISGSGGLTKNGTGSFYLRASSSYEGPTSINAGSILVSANNALGSTAGGTMIAGGSARLVFERSVNYSSAEPVTVNGAGFNSQGALVSIGNSSFAGPITLASASSIGSYPAGFTFTLSGAINTSGNALTLKGTGNIAVGGVVSGSGSLAKDGTGTATLSNTNTYSGATTVSAGTLSVTGSITSATTTQTGATLAGTGSIAAATATGGTVSPGTGVGILNGTSANFSSNGILRIQIQGYTTAGTHYDRLNLSGVLTTGSESTLTLDLAGLSSPGTASGIVLYSSQIGSFDVELVNNPNNYSACLSNGATALSVTIQLGACFQWVSAGPEAQSIRVSDILPAATRAWSAASQPVTIASLDSGVDYTHSALAQNIWINQGEIPADVRALLSRRGAMRDGRITLHELNQKGNQSRARVSDTNGNGIIDGRDLLLAWSDGLDGDGNGYVDDIIGWDFVNNDNDPMDDNGHGTHGTGILVQVAPAVEVLPVKFLDSAAVGSLADAQRALDYALAHGVSVSSNGWAASIFSQQWLDQLEKAEAAGHIFVTAAGNGDPALLEILERLHLSNVLVVGTNDSSGSLAEFSNGDPGIVDLAAPGVGVISAMPGGGYAPHSGTSISTAVVAGLAALVRAEKPTVSRSELIDAVLGALNMESSSSTGRLTGSSVMERGSFTFDLDRRSSRDEVIGLASSAEDDGESTAAERLTSVSRSLRNKLARKRI